MRAHVWDVNRGPLDDDAIVRLFERIIDEARRLALELRAQHPQAIVPEDLRDLLPAQ